MKAYEVVREIPNLCANNQMRDVFFSEVETDDPVEYVRGMLAGKAVEITADYPAPGRVNVYATVAGTVQKFLFTEL